MTRVLAGLVLGIVFFAALIYTTMAETSTECEVCVDFEGRHACSIAKGGDRELAMQQALSSACATITSGVTEVVACGATVPSSARCSD